MKIEIDHTEYVTITSALERDAVRLKEKMKKVEIGPQIDEASQFSHDATASCFEDVKAIRKRLYNAFIMHYNLG